MREVSSTNEVAWLGRFEQQRSLRIQGAFHLYSALCAETHEPRLVLIGAPGRDSDRVRAALAKVADAHGKIEHPRVARAVEWGEFGETIFVAFDCDVEIDLGGMLKVMREGGVRLLHTQADAFVCGLREALQAAHTRRDKDGRQLCIGTLSQGNVLFSRDGSYVLLGFGHNVIAHDEQGRSLGSEPIFEAPELVVGAEASPSGDFVALMQLARSALSVVRLADQIAQVLKGRSLPEDLELVRNMLWFERRVMAALPSQRATIEEAVSVSERIRQLLGVKPDHDGFQSTIASVFAALLPDQRPSRGALRIGPEMLWFEAPGGGIQKVHTRRTLRKLLAVLVDARLLRPGEPLTVGALVEAVWPGERLLGEAGANRVYVLLNELRRMGLRGVLERFGDGYRLDPLVAIELDVVPRSQASLRAQPLTPPAVRPLTRCFCVR